MVRHAGGQAPIAGLGSIIAQARARAGLSQHDLADALGIRPSSVSQWERGTTAPTLAMFRRMVAVLGPWPLLTALLPPDQADPTATAETADQQVQPPDRQELAGLVEQGLSDPQIGERYGVLAAMVTGWRRAEGLASQRPWGRRPPKQELARLISEGLSDQDIGQRHGVTHWTVIGWRREYRLRRSRPAQPSSRPPKQELAGLVAQGLSDREIGERYGRSASTVQKWRRAYKLAAGQRVGVDPGQAPDALASGPDDQRDRREAGPLALDHPQAAPGRHAHLPGGHPAPSSPGQDAPLAARHATGPPVPVAAAKPAPPPAPPHHDQQHDTDVQPAAEVAGPARQPTLKERV